MPTNLFAISIIELNATDTSLLVKRFYLKNNYQKPKRHRQSNSQLLEKDRKCCTSFWLEGTFCERTYETEKMWRKEHATLATQSYEKRKRNK